MTDVEELRERIHWLFEPEPDEDGLFPLEHPTRRLVSRYKLDFSYMEALNYEGSTMHKYTRLCGKKDTAVHALTRNSDVPSRLFEAGLRLFGDSIIAYHGVVNPHKKRTGRLRFYPPVILTFWAGFEAFIRYASELMLAAVREVPPPVEVFLREKEIVVERATIRERVRYQPVLERYAALLQYGYNYKVERGATWWQRLEKAKELRDYYSHIQASDARDISSADVLDQLETVLLGLIWPSAELQRTLHLGQYRLYYAWEELSQLAEPYVEQPFFKDWPVGLEPYQFHCNFANVDTARFPNPDEELAAREKRAARKSSSTKNHSQENSPSE